MNPDHILEQLDGMLRKSERQRRAAAEVAGDTPVAASGEQNNHDQIPRILLTEEMLASPRPAAAMSLEQMILDDQQVEDLIAQVYTDVNTRIEAMIPDWIDAALQQRVLEMTSPPHKEPSLSH